MTASEQNRDFAERGVAPDKSDYQRFEHPEHDVLEFAQTTDEAQQLDSSSTFPAAVRIFCPEIRVVARITVHFQPKYADQRPLYNLSLIKNQLTAYRCIQGRGRIQQVGEIVGKHGVPVEFPKSNIDGMAFQSHDDVPYIDLEMLLGWPGVEGKWTVSLHTTSDNKLKKEEWIQYITRVTMINQHSTATIFYNNQPRQLA